MNYAIANIKRVFETDRADAAGALGDYSVHTVVVVKYGNKFATVSRSERGFFASIQGVSFMEFGTGIGASNALLIVEAALRIL